MSPHFDNTREATNSKYKMLFDKGAKLTRGSIHVDGQPVRRLGFFEELRLKKASVFFEQAAAVNPTNGAPLFYLSKIEERLGRNDKRVEWLQKANSVEPNNLILGIELGAALAQQGKYNESISILSAAARNHPGEPRVHCNLALSLLLNGDVANAIKTFEHVVRLEPEVAINRKLLSYARDVSEGRKTIPANEREIADNV